jgi:tetratricopeptide (TPR) repeat protein
MRVARPTTITNRMMNRMILAIGIILLVGIPVIAVIYWNDRHVEQGPSITEQAITTAEAAVRDNPKDLGARNSLAAAYVKAGRFDDAVAQFGEVLKAVPGNQAALLGRGITYHLANNLEAAAADLSSVIATASKGEFAASDPQLEHAYYEYGVVLLEQGQAAQAAGNLEKALAIDSGDADALYSYGDALLKTGDPAKAVLALRRAVGYVPLGWCEPYAKMSEGYTSLGNQDGIAYATGMLALCNRDPEQAKQKLSSVGAGPLTNDALIGLALVAADQGDPATAADYYRKVLATDSGNVLATIGLNGLGMAPASPAASAPAASGSN